MHRDVAGTTKDTKHTDWRVLSYPLVADDATLPLPDLADIKKSMSTRLRLLLAPQFRTIECVGGMLPVYRSL